MPTNTTPCRHGLNSDSYLMPAPPDRNTDLERYKNECMRLSAELGRVRRKNASLEKFLGSVMRSLTWRAASLANALVARFTSLSGRPPIWTGQLEIIEKESEESQYPSHAELVAKYASSKHAEAATSSLGLTRVDSGSLLDFSEKAVEPSSVALILASSEQAAEYRGITDELPLIFEHDLASVDQSEVAGVFIAAGGPESPSEAPSFVLTREELPEPNFRSLLTFVRLAHRRIANHQQTVLDIPFNSRAYLSANPDVARAIHDGHYRDARDHWEFLGREEFLQGYRPYNLRSDVVDMGIRNATVELQQESAAEIEEWAAAPKISVLVPVYKVELHWLKAAVSSVENQLYSNWELCLVDDASGSDEISSYLNSLNDARIKVRKLDQNVGISRASNAALEIATGEYIALLDHDDELTVDALWLMARGIVEHNPDILYSDEAKLDVTDQICDPHFKPDYSREMILSQNYISHLGVYRRSLVNAVDGFRAGYEGSQDHDLLLRCLKKATSILHIPRILYYWRKVPGSTASRFGEKDYAWDRGVNAIKDVLSDGIRVNTVVKGTYPGTYRVSREIDHEPLVSIIIPFRDEPELLDQCLGSIIAKTGYQNFEIIGIDNQSSNSRIPTLKAHWAEQDQRIRFIDFDDEFNYSAINNFAAQQANGEYLLLLNNDTEVINDEWLSSMLEYAQFSDVGAVGALLLYPDDTIQHAGVILGIGGVAGHSHKYLPVSSNGYFSRPHIIQNMSAVTGACLLVSKTDYFAVGGLDEEDLAIAFNDVDFCLRLLERGRRNVYSPYARLYHYESKSRGAEDSFAKIQRFNKEAATVFGCHIFSLAAGDRYFNPNLSPLSEQFQASHSI